MPTRQPAMTDTAPVDPDLLAAVRRNCDIADARHAGDYTLCVYLLKMREYFRWEQGYPFRAALPKQAVGDWLRDREQRWSDLEGADYEPLPVNGASVDPFETAAVNAHLLPRDLVYSGGLGNNGRPHFFLGRLVRREQTDDYRILVSAEEYARDLASPPAMALDGTIFVRRESLRRMIWEKVEEARWNKGETPMSRAIASHDFEGDTDAALEAMTDEQVDTLVLHEIGEVRAGEILGEEWEGMLANMPYTKAELMARAVRDHLADALSTLPELLTRDAPSMLHFYFATLTNMRKSLCPGLLDAYRRWVDSGDRAALRAQQARGVDHWRRVANDMLALHRRHGEEAAPHLERLIEANPL